MPVDLEPFPRTREDLGIDKDAVVFTLVARGILRKGWRASITAFIRLRERHPEAKLHLLLCGEGEQTERHQKAYERDQDITFLGYQSRIPGLYRLSDVAIVPTRFEGESFPLCVIQALQTSTPVISTRVGEIASMIEPPGSAPAGILLDPVRDTEKFIKSLMEAMEAMLSEARRNEFAVAAKELAGSYGIDNVAHDYMELYAKILKLNLSLNDDESS
jgi:glycosyltransferase involved in cell wall biosynthesis